MIILLVLNSAHMENFALPAITISRALLIGSVSALLKKVARIYPSPISEKNNKNRNNNLHAEITSVNKMSCYVSFEVSQSIKINLSVMIFTALGVPYH